MISYYTFSRCPVKGLALSFQVKTRAGACIIRGESQPGGKPWHRPKPTEREARKKLNNNFRKTP